ncbi:MAG: hypothetical protein M3Y82_13800 [Verrucomicrobiota bacterium]|nr:hypothetical protein [Verrucomicrobiota bacterium]
MNAVKVDEANRVRLPMLTPGDFYEPEVHGEKVLLRKVPKPRGKMSKKEIFRAIDESPVRFVTTWEELKKEIR